MRVSFALVAAVLVALSPVTRAVAQVSAPATDLAVTLVTFGEGEEVFERFGHDALWFHDPRTGEDVAYHWGLFDFNEPHFIARFVSGDTHYSMGGMSAVGLIEAERRSGRSVTLQQLNLTPAQAHSLYDFVQWNARDENKYYRYDYFRDNCATRLRDALDRTLGGALKARFDTVHTALTYRSESIRLTDGDRPAQLAIDLALGQPADRPISAWQSFFIPMRLRDALRGVTVPGATGTSVPLVSRERMLAQLPGKPAITELATVPSLLLRYLVCGVVLALFVVGLRIMVVTRRCAAWGLALLASAWWMLCGVLGVLITLAWVATRHVFWARNEHLLLLSPLCLALVVLAPMALLTGRASRVASFVAISAAALGVVAAIISVFPGGQASGPVIALLLPVHLALAWALTLPRPARVIA